MSKSWAINSKLRSYDFEHTKTCYIEGTLLGFERLEGCDRYIIRVEKVVFSNQEEANSSLLNNNVYPPVNGTPKLFGGVCNLVELIPNG